MGKRILFFVLLIFLPLFARAAFFDPKAEFRTIKTAHFYIHYPKEIEPIAHELRNIVEPVYERMTEKLNWKPWGRTHVVLSDHTDLANGLATVVPANYVLLHVTPPNADSSLDHYRNYLELLFTHEFTHIVHIDQHYKWANPPHWVTGKIIAPNGITPGWVREGIAAHEETVETGRGRGNSSYGEMVLRTAILENRFPKIDEIAGLGFKWPGADSQYIFGVRFFGWLADKFGEEKIREFSNKYAGGFWLFSLNNKAKRVFGKSFYNLWQDWKSELEEKFGSQQTNIHAQGQSPFEPLVKNKNQLIYPTPYPKGDGVAYVEYGSDDAAKIVLMEEMGKKPQTIPAATIGQMSFSADGNVLFYSTLISVEKHKNYSEIFAYNLLTKKRGRLVHIADKKKSLRVMDPDVAPNGDLVMVVADRGTEQLRFCRKGDISGKEATKKEKKDLTGDKILDGFEYDCHTITHASPWTQFGNPRFSPDGSRVVVSRQDPNGNRDIFIYNLKGEEVSRITNDRFVDYHPTWSPEGHFIYFESDRTGVANIYRTDLARKTTQRVTNVLTGAYQPSLSADGKMLYVRYYTSTGWDLYQTAVADLGDYPIDSEFSLPDFPQKKFALENSSDPPAFKKYQALPGLLVPRFLLPTFTFFDDSFPLGLVIGKSDPLYRHAWTLFGDYRLNSGFVGGGGNYSYTRYNPTLSVGAIRYVINWGNIFGTGTNFFESRHQGYIGTGYGYKRHGFGLNYFVEDRDNHTDFPGQEQIESNTVPPVQRDRFVYPVLERNAGVHASYSFSNYKFYENSISQENGLVFKLGVDMTDSLLGSSNVNEQQVVVGDLRYYWELPWANHHVLAFKTAGAWVWGDVEQIGGAFRFGGPFGEGTLAGHSPRVFPFRGLPGITFARDRVLLFSTEYRLPLFNLERGPGIWPVFLRKAHLSLFGDYGDSWVRGGKDNVAFFENFLLGVGAELKGDFVFGYGLPVTGRMGYGLIILNRDRIVNAGLRDSLFNLDAKNGSFYLQFGTSF